MVADSLPNFTMPHWHTLTTAIIGMTSASLALLLGFILVGRRRRSAIRLKEEVAQRDPFVFGSATEKRTSLRRRGNPIKVLVTDADASAKPEEAWVLDRSTGGLCMRTERRSIPVGTILSVRTSNAPASVPWTQLEVKSCREDGSGWELGCQFLKTPSWSVLLLFG